MTFADQSTHVHGMVKGAATILDDFTHFVVVQLIANRNEAFYRIKNCVAEVKAEKNIKILTAGVAEMIVFRHKNEDVVYK